MTHIEPTSKHMSIDTRADHVLALFHRQREKDQHSKENARASADRQDIAVLQTLLATEIEQELLDTLEVEYAVRRDNHTIRPEAVFRYAGILWRIVQDFYHRSPTPWRWSISATSGENGFGCYQETSLSREAERQNLQTILLLLFAERRKQMRKKEEEAATRAEQQRQAHALKQAEEEREERERAERIAKADLEDAHWRKELDARKQHTRETMWRWPATETPITIYALTYTTAVSQGENGELLVEQEGGWTVVDHLDEYGYIHLQPVKPSSWSRRTTTLREIKLDLTIHRPIWERRTFRSVDDLPETLRQEVSVCLDHVVREHDPHLDGKARFRKAEDGRDDDIGPYRESVGSLPLPWIQALVEQQAATVSN